MSRLSRGLRIALVVFTHSLLTSVASPAYAATVTWSSAVGGNWSDGTKWSTNPDPPQPGDDVVIAVAGIYTVTLDIDATIKTLALGGSSGAQTLQTNNRTLTITNPSTVHANGVLTVSGGTLTGASALTVGGTLNWTAGLISGSGALTVNGALIIDSGSSKTLSGRTIVSTNVGQWRNAGTVNLSQGAVLRNAAGGTFDIQGAALMSVSGTPGTETFDNDGTLTKTGAGTTTFDVIFESSGPVTVSNGILSASRGGSWSSTVTIATVLRFNGGTHQLANLTMTGGGRAEITAGTVNSNGPVTVASGTTLANNATLGGGSALTVDGQFEWNAGSVLGAGAFAVNGMLVFDTGSTKTLNGRTLVSNNKAEWRSAGAINLANGAVLHNSATGTFTVLGAAIMGISGAASTETFNNEGVLVKAESGTTVLDVLMDVSGSVVVNNGILLASRAGTWAGPVDIATTLRFGGGTHNLIGVTLVGPGRTEVTAGTVNTGGVVTVTSTMTLATSATLGGAGGLVVDGRLEWTGGTITGTGALTVNGTLIIDGGSGKTLNGRTIVSNHRTEWRSGGSMTLANDAVLRNAAGATFDIQSNAFMGNASPTSTGVFESFGILTKSSGAGVSTLDVDITSTGSVNANSGILSATRSGSWRGPFTVVGTMRLASGTHTLTDLTIGGTGRFEIGGSVSMVGAITVGSAATLAPNGGTIDGSSTITVDGRLEWTAGIIRGSGPFLVKGSLALEGGQPKFLLGRTVESRGAGVWRGTGRVALGEGAILRNAATGSFDIQNDASMNLATPAASEAFENLGSLSKSAGAGATMFDVLLTNAGRVEIRAGTLTVTRGVYRQTGGSTTLNGGNLNVALGDGMDLNAGDLAGTGTVTGQVRQVGGTVSPGTSPGRLAITGVYSQDAFGSLQIEIGGLAAATQYDQVRVDASASLHGTLNVALINGFVPELGDQFLIVDGSTSGQFDSVQLPTLPSTLAWQIGFDPVILTVVGGAATPTATAITPSVTPTASRTRTPSVTVSATSTATPPSPTPTRSAVATLTATPSGTATVSPSASATASPTPTVDVTATATGQPPCVGDCNGDGFVRVNELVTGVNIALGRADVDGCSALDANSSGTVTVDELVAAVSRSLQGCF